jgi:cell division protease FtsH
MLSSVTANTALLKGKVLHNVCLMYNSFNMDLFKNKGKTNYPPEKGGPKGGPPKQPKQQKFWSNVLSIVLIFLIIMTIYSIVADDTARTEEIPISQLALDVKQGRVSEITVRGEEVEILYRDGVVRTTLKEVGAPISDTLVNYGVDLALLEDVTIQVESPTGLMFWLISFAPLLIPLLFIVFFFWYISRQMRGAGAQAFNFGQSKARFIDPANKSQRVLFKDVAGVKEAKEELLEIVDFLKNPKKFLLIGARIPKGVILMGAPGTGKTLLARAVAGEAGVPFFSISGSEFVEMFVGVGASRVRDLFKMAKKAAPAIIFIDEIDAVGRVRGTGVGGGNDEREQTLNQILVEMDGFEPNEKVIILAATNRPDVLDPALLRPGRFDRRVALTLPDRKERNDILHVHANKKPLTEDVNLEVIAERTPGFSGADLQSLMNEGAILAARENRKKISQYDLIRSIEKVMLGPERRSHLLSKKEKEITAYHEAGHALVASVLPHADPVHKISIISRGRAAGYVLNLPLEERKLQSKKAFLDSLAVSLGGYVTEKMIFNDLSTGPSSDLQVSTALARDMVTKYGMSDLGPIALEGAEGRALIGRGIEDREYSETVSAKIDAEVSRIMGDSYKRAEEVITKHKKVLKSIAEKLIEVETMERAEFEQLLILNGITPKKKEDLDEILPK